MSRIVVKNLGKKYKRYPNHWKRLLEWASGERFCMHEDRWVLQGISFEVEKGASVGIIGQNGAGKSTLLKILTRTTQPTEGTFSAEGRIAAILELGMGFHPDFTGRQNAIILCQIMGMSREEIECHLPSIERFSELGDYMDQPLRTYSTGMLVRLSFSVATAVRPEVLILDEALSVGDSYFQHKSMQRIRSFKEQGTTLLFVSHDPGAVKSLCDQAILLDQGLLVREGPPDHILDYYNAMIAKKEKDAEIQQTEAQYGRIMTRSGSGGARSLSVEILDKEGRPARAFRVGDAAKIRAQIAFNERIEKPTIGILIRDRLGNEVFGTNTYHMASSLPLAEKGVIVTTEFNTVLNLGPGNYSLTVAVHTQDTHLECNYDWWDQIVVFQVIPNDSFQFIGTASLPVRVEYPRTARFNPESEWRAKIETQNKLLEASPSQVMKIPLFVHNEGVGMWDSNDAKYPVHASYHLLDSEGKMLRFDNVRTPLPRRIPPNDSVGLQLLIQAPERAGHYLLEIDLVTESVAWFKERGSETVQLPFVVLEPTSTKKG